MRLLPFLSGRNYSALALAGAAFLPLAACGSEGTDGGGTAGSPAQSGSAGAVGTAGTSSVAGTSATGGSGTAGTTSTTAGTSSGGTTTGGSSSTAGSSTGGTGTGGTGAAGASGSGGSGGSSVDPTKLDKFSFFVTSMAAMIRLSKSDKGFGGDFRYGTGDGLMGADKICSEIAEASMPGASAKQWRAFLSTKKGPVHAKDRIGAGPWYDRTGRVVSMTLANLLKNRPDADAAIKEDLPNEFGIGNHRPNPNAPADDNHHTLTGSNTDGTLFTGEGNMATCLDWTSSSTNNKTTGDGATGRPRIGFSWSVQNRTNWISGQTEGGCAPGITGVGETNGGSDPSNPIVGSGGGYGGIYCFALMP